MLIKLGIIAGVIILGGMIFSNEIDNIFPSTSASMVNSLKDDASNFGQKATTSVEQRIDESLNKISEKTEDIISNEISNTGEKITNNISDVKESSQKAINNEISNFNPIKSIQNIFEDNSNSHNSKSSNSQTSNTVNTSIDSEKSFPMMHETLSLSTKQHSDEILLHYSDSSGKTNSVNVVIRTTEKEIFSGTFFTSMFETVVNDAIDVPYYIDMIVDHKDYGIVTSSVFNPGDSSDSKINGVFSQS